MLRLSILICVYNVEKDLFIQCLDSIYSSTLKDYEVIVVDDGSGVNYLDLVDKYKFDYVKLENNTGTLHARSVAIMRAKAPLVCFVDADDIVSFDYLEALMQRQEETDADIVLNDWAFFTKNVKYYCEKDSTINSNLDLHHDEILWKYFSQRGLEHSYYVLWNKVYKLDILKSVINEINKLDVNEKIIYAEDVLINYFAFKFAARLANVHLGYYFYRIHYSQQSNVQDDTKLSMQIKNVAKVFSYIENDLKKSNLYDRHKDDFISWITFVYSSHRSIAEKRKNVDLINLIKASYPVERLSYTRKINSPIYNKHVLLPNNLNEIDKILNKIYYNNNQVVVFCKKTGYTYKQLCGMIDVLKRDNIILTHNKRTKAEFVMPKEKIKLVHKIIHNYFIYRLGVWLFPKGSKIRQRLKSKF